MEEYLSYLLTQFQTFYEGVQAASPTVAATFYLAAFAAVLALLSFLRGGSKDGSGATARLNQSVQKVNVQLSDVITHSKQVQTVLKNEIQVLEQKLLQLATRHCFHVT